MKLVQTCRWAPEQYDVFDEDEQIGYLRLRHGHFTAQVPDSLGRLVYESDPIGDGAFDNEDERRREIHAALTAIATDRIDSIIANLEPNDW